MTRPGRTFLAFLVLLCLFTACGQENPPSSQGKGAASPTARPTVTPSATPSNPKDDICPGYLHNVRGCLTPHALRVAYGVESLYQKGFTGKGQTVIDLVSFGSPTLRQDMAVFDKQFSLPAVNLEIISPLNIPTYDPRGDKAGWAGETTLDVQIIHAIAPDAKIIVLSSPVAEIQGTVGLPEFRQLLQYAMDKKLGSIVSQSWGASELTLQDEAGQKELALWNTLFQKATTEHGMTFFASSGDNGAADYTDLDSRKISTVPTTSFPADSPWVTGVGGTTVQHTLGLYTESAWSKSGGGFSRFYQTPDYQKNLSATVKEQLKNRRGVPDVAGAADPYTGLAVYIGGDWTMAGGTSASAPLWGGISALANQIAQRPLGFLNPALYKIANTNAYAQSFRDITKGDNSYQATKVKGYPAVEGWDPVTGLGSPIVEKLIPQLIQEIQPVQTKKTA